MNTTAAQPHPFLGLAPFLRRNIAGEPLLPVGQELLSMAALDENNANLWMNLATVMFCLGQDENARAIQAQALAMQRTYTLPAAIQPTKIRLLLLVAAGDLSANTPLDCLLENSDIELVYHYVDTTSLQSFAPPDHDILMVALSESDDNRQILAMLVPLLAHWPKPVLNAPQYIGLVERDMASQLLQNAPGLSMPLTYRCAREVLENVAAGRTTLPTDSLSCDFPVIVRPVGSHAGRDLSRLDSPQALDSYLATVRDAEFFISRFVDYSSADGLFRKYRIALVDGQTFACHMAISSSWMIHYVNAGMYDDPAKRAEEVLFMQNFNVFLGRHWQALNEIHRRTQLEYLCIDAAETRDGELLVFEIDHAMVVHAMDPEALFPYKAHYIDSIKTAFRDMLIRLNASSSSTA